MGFEPTTSAVTGRRSNQLSHQAISFKRKSSDTTKFALRLRLVLIKWSCTDFSNFTSFSKRNHVVLSKLHTDLISSLRSS